MKRTMIAAIATAVTGSAVLAQSLNDQIIEDLTAKGYQRIEIDNGLAQTKVEAIRGTEKLEIVWDSATGRIIKQEIEQVRAGEDTSPGLEIRDRARDFVDVARLDDDDDEDGERHRHRNGRGHDDDDDHYDDDDHRGHHGRGHDDDDDDDGDDNSGRGSDDDDDYDDDDDDYDDDDHDDDDDEEDDDDDEDDDD